MAPWALSPKAFAHFLDLNYGGVSQNLVSFLKTQFRIKIFESRVGLNLVAI